MNEFRRHVDNEDLSGAMRVFSEASDSLKESIAQCLFKNNATVLHIFSDARIDYVTSLLDWCNQNTINIRESKRGMTPLMYAVLDRRLDIVQLLISRGAQFERIENHSGNTALGLVVYNGWVEGFSFLLRSGARVSATCSLTILSC